MCAVSIASASVWPTVEKLDVLPLKVVHGLCEIRGFNSPVERRVDGKKKSRFTNEQAAFALSQTESGIAVEDVSRKLAVSQQTFYRWRKKFDGMGVEDLRRLKSPEEENRRLKSPVANQNVAT